MFALANGVFAIISINSLFPAYTEERLTLYEVSVTCEQIFFFGANWFYSIKYYETASDLEIMLQEAPKKSS